MGPHNSQHNIISTFGDYNLEMLMENFVAAQTHQNKDLIEKNLHISETLKQLTSTVKSLVTQRKTLESRNSHFTRIPPGPFLEGHMNTLTIRREK